MKGDISGRVGGGRRSDLKLAKMVAGPVSQLVLKPSITGSLTVRGRLIWV